MAVKSNLSPCGACAALNQVNPIYEIIFSKLKKNILALGKSLVFYFSKHEL